MAGCDCYLQSVNQSRSLVVRTRHGHELDPEVAERVAVQRRLGAHSGRHVGAEERVAIEDLVGRKGKGDVGQSVSR